MLKRSISLIVLVPLFCAVPTFARETEHSGKKDVPLAPLAFTTLDLTQGVTPELLVNVLLGPGVSVSDVAYSGADTAAGVFMGGIGIIAFDDGILLGSGCISSIVGPNLFDDMSCDNALPGDPDLSLLSGYDTYDATVLEFDFEVTDPAMTILLFSYVFASDEYNEWVYTPFNDVFAFWVDGQNCALVPDPSGISSPVTIDTVNGGNPLGSGNETNSVLYRNNDLGDGGGSIDTEMDGLTLSLTCQVQLDPQITTHHIRLAIADSSDPVYDSNVMIRAGSLTPTDLVVSLGPPSATNPVGTTHTVTATVLAGLGVPQPGLEVDFEVLTGPNAGAIGACSASEECLTDAAGQVSFTYTGSLIAGTDVIRACIDDAGGNDNCAPAVLKHWVDECGEDGTPCGGTPSDCEYQDTCLDGLCQDAGFKPPTVECRPVMTSCDIPEICTGLDAACPLDQHVPDGTACLDGDPCTADEECSAGVCTGDPAPAPEEVDNGVRIAASQGTTILTWNMALGSTSSDILRGSLAALPVGPGGGDEMCVGDDEDGTTFRIDANPPPAAGYWYLVRGVNACGTGPYGWQTEGGMPTVPRGSTTCP